MSKSLFTVVFALFCLCLAPATVAAQTTPPDGKYKLTDTLNGVNGGGTAEFESEGAVKTVKVKYTTDGGTTWKIVNLAHVGNGEYHNGNPPNSTKRFRVLKVEGVWYWWMENKNADGEWVTEASGTMAPVSDGQ